MIKFLIVSFLLLLYFPFTLHSQDFVTRYVAIDTSVVAFTNCLLIDGTGSPARSDQTVVIRDGKITEVGPSAQLDLPQDAYIIDMTDKTPTPGFVMMHEHMYYTAPSNGEFSRFNQQDYTFPKMYLAGGTTTARTTGSVDPISDPMGIQTWCRL